MENNTTTDTAANTQPTPPPAHLEVAKSKRATDVDELVHFANIVTGIYVDTKRILANYPDYPASNLTSLAEAVSEATRGLAIAATFILNPDATAIADGVNERIQARIDCGID